MLGYPFPGCDRAESGRIQVSAGKVIMGKDGWTVLIWTALIVGFIRGAIDFIQLVMRDQPRNDDGRRKHD